MDQSFLGGICVLLKLMFTADSINHSIKAQPQSPLPFPLPHDQGEVDYRGIRPALSHHTNVPMICRDLEVVDLVSPMGSLKTSTENFPTWSLTEFGHFGPPCTILILL
jgi:hypothetical protein